jgi:hypothetical protein
MSGLSGLSAEELRAAVRAVLREVLPADVVADPGGRSHDVTIASEADLTAFVRRVAALCEDPAQRAALQDGRHGFRLAGTSPGLVTAAAQPPRPADAVAGQPPRPAEVRVERGAVTERTVMKAAAEGARLVLGRGAVLTPLARDKARSLGVEIEKER